MLKYLVYGLVGYTFAEQVSNPKIEDASTDGFTVSWEWTGDSSVTNFEVEVDNSDMSEPMVQTAVDANSVSFTDLDEATDYNVIITPLLPGRGELNPNATDSTIAVDSLTFRAMTRGNGLYPKYAWQDGATGTFMWDEKAECGSVLVFSFPCGDIEFTLHADTLVEQDTIDNTTTIKVYISDKFIHSFPHGYATWNVQGVCNWIDMVDSVVTFGESEFLNDNIAVASIDATTNSWINGNTTFNQLFVGIGEEYRYCIPGVRFSVSCNSDTIKSTSSWSLDDIQGPFVNDNGTTDFRANLKDVWQGGVGFTFSYISGECSSVSNKIELEYLKAPGVVEEEEDVEEVFEEVAEEVVEEELEGDLE